MKRNYLMLSIGFWVVVNIVLMAAAQVNKPLVSTATPSATPSPNAKTAERKEGCTMPLPVKLRSSPTPTPTPTPIITLEPSDPMKVRKGHGRRETFTRSMLQAIAMTTDSDCDGISNGEDNCVAAYNPRQIDRDKDGFGDACDPVTNRIKKYSKKRSKLK